MMKYRFHHVASLFFRQLIRDKTFIVFSLSAIILLCVSLSFNAFAIGQPLKITKGLAVFSLDFFIFLIILVLFINLVSWDLNKKGLHFLFSKSLYRWEYLIGISVAALLTALLFIFFILVTLSIIFIIHTEIWILEILTAGYLALLKGILLLSVSALAAVTFRADSAKIITVLIFIFGHSFQMTSQMVEGISNPLLKYTSIAVQAIIPNFDFLNKRIEIMYSMEISPEFLVYATIYALSYAVLLYIISLAIFKSKRF